VWEVMDISPRPGQRFTRYVQLGGEKDSEVRQKCRRVVIVVSGECCGVVVDIESCWILGVTSTFLPRAGLCAAIIRYACRFRQLRA